MQILLEEGLSADPMHLELRQALQQAVQHQHQAQQARIALGALGHLALQAAHGLDLHDAAAPSQPGPGQDGDARGCCACVNDSATVRDCSGSGRGSRERLEPWGLQLPSDACDKAWGGDREERGVDGAGAGRQGWRPEVEGDGKMQLQISGGRPLGFRACLDDPRSHQLVQVRWDCSCMKCGALVVCDVQLPAGSCG